MRLTAVYDDQSLKVTFTYAYAERHHAWDLIRDIDEMGTRTHVGWGIDRWVLPRERKDTLRKHLHSLDWPDLTWAFTESGGLL